ncbi:MAG TPA: ribosome small subunit-dependent GTPase A [Abditibacteriaceae bacterium]|nr:ribosome small subunit-dependent GTPase A [Abditibacteriaceae bacterium]
MTEPQLTQAKDAATDGFATDALMTGTVVRAGGGVYEVDVQEATIGEPLLCQVRGKLKQGRRASTQPVVVGDKVRARPLTSFGADARGRRLREGYIEEVLPRASWLGRARYQGARAQKLTQIAVANLDQVIIVMAVREPNLNTHRLDRFLVLAESSSLNPVICFNKCDLITKREIKKEIEPLASLYSAMGYVPLLTSAETGTGIKDLRTHLQNHISAVLGSSGVGKSSLLNAVQLGLHLWVGDVMEMGKGRHITTEVSLHPLDGGGYIADVPGIKTVSLLEQQDVNLPLCFPEFALYLNGCRFNNCSHEHEPGCAVRAAVEEGAIAPSRYDSYLKILQDEKAAIKNQYS